MPKIIKTLVVTNVYTSPEKAGGCARMPFPPDRVLVSEVIPRVGEKDQVLFYGAPDAAIAFITSYTLNENGCRVIGDSETYLEDFILSEPDRWSFTNGCGIRSH